MMHVVPESPAVRVLVVDDHPVVRGGLSALLRTIDGIDVVGEAADGAQAIADAARLRPDVVLMDVRMPGIDGVEATRRIREAQPDTKVLVLTMFDDDATVFTAMQAGAGGYLLKDAEQHDIVRAVRAVAGGEVIFGPGVAGHVLRFFASPSGHAPSPPNAFPELTDRERDILELLAQGRRTGAIAQTLFLSPKTVSNHLTSIFAKLQVVGRSEAIVRAREGGFGGGS
jgi:DNA-binding NarL/FixJ family response regulator